ncbi:MAG: LysM peptidoglycan-binding domain-containing protein [Flavobacteriales bacterium]|nr:LysM peptidoglycan-binding domain-containing protein [Flavobacteriales bacterium]
MSNQKTTFKISTFLFATIALVILGGWAYTYTYTQGKAVVTVSEESIIPPDLSMLAELEVLKNDLSTKDGKIEALTRKLAELHATLESSEADFIQEGEMGTHTIHVVKKGESLWSISERYHGHGFKNTHIATNNELHNLDHIEPGDTLIIKN